MRDNTDIVNNLIASMAYAKILNTDNISDGYHTFGELYRHRAVLFAAVCHDHIEDAWVTRNYADGRSVYGDMFLAGIHLPCGDVSYHIDGEYWELFSDLPYLTRSPSSDGDAPNDVLDQITSTYILSTEPPKRTDNEEENAPPHIKMECHLGKQ